MGNNGSLCASSERWVGRQRRVSAGVTGVRNVPAVLKRRWSARGAHVASPMVGGRLRRLKGSPCLQHAHEGHNRCRRPRAYPLHPPTQGPPRDFGTPLSRRPNPHALGGVLVACGRPANRPGLLFVVVGLNLLLLLDCGRECPTAKPRYGATVAGLWCSARGGALPISPIRATTVSRQSAFL